MMTILHGIIKEVKNYEERKLIETPTQLVIKALENSSSSIENKLSCGIF